MTKSEKRPIYDSDFGIASDFWFGHSGLFLRYLLGGLLLWFGRGFFGRAFCEGAVVFLPGFGEALGDSSDDFDGALGITAARAGDHHPGRHEGLAEGARGGGGREILEVGGR